MFDKMSCGNDMKTEKLNRSSEIAEEKQLK